ncbi:hypothetical protein BCV70DRAFT_202074 [Testicularia cyperi]|uniref:Uncharacterized protein n=1 Tax=Testicularia cyperi TaxID=1882483 RepID=A0A317XJ66_9BASI|nr:hypothetical protein BCV70DRAFT_202074 [Testicularia cyperi]
MQPTQRLSANLGGSASRTNGTGSSLNLGNSLDALLAGGIPHSSVGSVPMASAIDLLPSNLLSSHQQLHPPFVGQSHSTSQPNLGATHLAQVPDHLIHNARGAQSIHQPSGQIQPQPQQQSQQQHQSHSLQPQQQTPHQSQGIHQSQHQRQHQHQHQPLSQHVSQIQQGPHQHQPQPQSQLQPQSQHSHPPQQQGQSSQEAQRQQQQQQALLLSQLLAASSAPNASFSTPSSLLDQHASILSDARSSAATFANTLQEAKHSCPVDRPDLRTMVNMLEKASKMLVSELARGVTRLRALHESAAMNEVTNYLTSLGAASMQNGMAGQDFFGALSSYGAANGIPNAQQQQHPQNQHASQQSLPFDLNLAFLQQNQQTSSSPPFNMFGNNNTNSAQNHPDSSGGGGNNNISGGNSNRNVAPSANPSGGGSHHGSGFNTPFANGMSTQQAGPQMGNQAQAQAQAQTQTQTPANSLLSALLSQQLSQTPEPGRVGALNLGFLQSIVSALGANAPQSSALGALSAQHRGELSSESAGSNTGANATAQGPGATAASNAAALSALSSLGVGPAMLEALGLGTPTNPSAAPTAAVPNGESTANRDRKAAPGSSQHQLDNEADDDASSLDAEPARKKRKQLRGKPVLASASPTIAGTPPSRTDAAPSTSLIKASSTAGRLAPAAQTVSVAGPSSGHIGASPLTAAPHNLGGVPGPETSSSSAKRIPTLGVGLRQEGDKRYRNRKLLRDLREHLYRWLGTDEFRKLKNTYKVAEWVPNPALTDEEKKIIASLPPGAVASPPITTHIFHVDFTSRDFYRTNQALIDAIVTEGSKKVEAKPEAYGIVPGTIDRDHLEDVAKDLMDSARSGFRMSLRTGIQAEKEDKEKHEKYRGVERAKTKCRNREIGAMRLRHAIPKQLLVPGAYSDDAASDEDLHGLTKSEWKRQRLRKLRIAKGWEAVTPKWRNKHLTRAYHKADIVSKSKQMARWRRDDPVELPFPIRLYGKTLPKQLFDKDWLAEHRKELEDEPYCIKINDAEIEGWDESHHPLGEDTSDEMEWSDAKESDWRGRGLHTSRGRESGTRSPMPSSTQAPNGNRAATAPSNLKVDDSTATPDAVPASAIGPTASVEAIAAGSSRSEPPASTGENVGAAPISNAFNTTTTSSSVASSSDGHADHEADGGNSATESEPDSQPLAPMESKPITATAGAQAQVESVS